MVHTRAFTGGAAASLAVAALIGSGAASGPRAGGAAALQTRSVAQRFAGAVKARNGEEVLRVLAPEAVVREHVAVVAAGRDHVAAWLDDCLLHDFALVPGSEHAQMQGMSWRFLDSTGCYWRRRPGAATALWPGAGVNPADGVLQVTIADDIITALTLTYSDAWQMQYRRSVAQQLEAARAQTTATAEVAPAPKPARQERATPPPAAWLVSIAAALLCSFCAILVHPRK